MCEREGTVSEGMMQRWSISQNMIGRPTMFMRGRGYRLFFPTCAERRGGVGGVAAAGLFSVSPESLLYLEPAHEDDDVQGDPTVIRHIVGGVVRTVLLEQLCLETDRAFDESSDRAGPNAAGEAHTGYESA